MLPLQKVAMGLVIVVVDPSFGGWDGLPDPLGWVLVLLGLAALTDRVDGARTLTLTAWVALAVALGTYPPAVTDHLGASYGWLLSLPQVVFCALACRAFAPYAEDRAGRLRWLFWAFVVVGVAPVVVLGGGVEALLVPAAGLAVLSASYLVYQLFRLAGRPRFVRDRPA